MITGSGQGLGKVFATRLLQEGAKVRRKEGRMGWGTEPKRSASNIYKEGLEDTGCSLNIVFFLVIFLYSASSAAIAGV